jgi:hypothetical protein
MHRFNLKNVNDAEDKVQYEVETPNRLKALGNFDDNVDIDRA